MTAEYKAWDGIKTRCRDQENQNYGGRGIVVCERWLNSFESFLEDMGKRPSNLYSIDRIDNNGNYEPSNCRWATKSEQALNRRTNHLLTVDGATRTIHEWSIEYGIPHAALWQRVNSLGWTHERAVKQPSRRWSASSVTYMGETKSIPEWAREFDIDHHVLRERLKLGWDMSRAVSAPLKNDKRRKKETK